MATNRPEPTRQDDGSALIDRQLGDDIEHVGTRPGHHPRLAGDHQSVAALLTLASARPLVHGVEDRVPEVGAGRVDTVEHLIQRGERVVGDIFGSRTIERQQPCVVGSTSLQMPPNRETLQHSRDFWSIRSPTA